MPEEKKGEEKKGEEKKGEEKKGEEKKGEEKKAEEKKAEEKKREEKKAEEKKAEEKKGEEKKAEEKKAEEKKAEEKKGDNNMSAIEEIYNKITDVIGGTNSNQLFCMLMPGTVLDKDTYDYDINGSKPSLVLDAESELVDQVFDICQITAGNNGKLLSEQYLMALSNFIPPIDSELEKGRSELRKVLSKPMKYTLADGSTCESTLQGIYEMLVEKWVNAKKQWFEDQEEKRKALFPPTGTLSIKEAREEYNKWYQAVAESRTKEIESKYHAIVSIFSPDEFGEIMSVLSCGNKGRFEELKELAETVRKQNESGGYTYPVDLQPRDWFRALESNFNYIDLLESPDYICNQINQKQDLLDMQLLQLDAMQAMIPPENEIAKKYQELENAKANYDKAQIKLSDTYTQNTVTAAKIVLEKYTQIATKCAMAAATGGGSEIAAESIGPLVSELGPVIIDATTEFASLAQTISSGTVDSAGDSLKPIESLKSISKMVNPGSDIITSEEFIKLADMQSRVTKSQQDLLTAASGVTDVALKYITMNNMYTDLKPFYQRLKILTRDIADLKNKLKVASVADKQILDKRFSDEISNRFLQVDISFNRNQMDSDSKLASSASQTKWSVSFFIGGANGSTSKSSSSFASEVVSKDTKIEISFLVTKVNIIRKWFNPGIFALSQGMLRVSDVTASTILPAYPVAFVIAKDVTIKFDIKESMVKQANEALQSQMAAGGGFFGFSVSHSNSSYAESKSFSSRVEGKSVTIRIPGPQIIGWYLESTPEDKSKLYNPMFLTEEYEAAFKNYYTQ